MDRHLKWEMVGTGPGAPMVATLLDAELTDPTTIDAVGLCLAELIEQEGCRKLVLDCAAVRYTSSSFLSKVIKLNRMMAALGGSLELRRLRPAVRHAFHVTRLDRLLTIGDEPPPEAAR